jgi:hypothetical protein
MMKNTARPRRLVLALYVASAALVTVQQAILGHSKNVSIFRSASLNPFAGRDLYAAHPDQHVEFYKYSPTFAVLFAPLAYLPFALTFLCWSLLNHPRRLRFAAIFIAVRAAAIVLPLVAIPPGDLLAQYRSWHAIEAKDALRRGYSLMHYVHAWFGVDWPNWPLQAAGTALLLLPLALHQDRWSSLEFRRLFLCSLLVYSVLFNHASESPSFVVAHAGIMIWYVSSPPSRVRTAVTALTLLVMVVHDVDVVPRWVKHDLLVPYRIKGIPCLVAWFVMQWELLVTARSTARIDTGSFSPPASAAGA